MSSGRAELHLKGGAILEVGMYAEDVALKFKKEGMRELPDPDSKVLVKLPALDEGYQGIWVDPYEVVAVVPA